MSDKEKAESSSETEEIASAEETAVVTETPTETGEPAEFTERDKIYAKYNEDTYEAGSENEEEKPVKETEKKEEAKKEEKKDKTKTEDKTVPLGALHEERQKRKESQAKVVELEQQVKELMQEIKSKPKEETEEYIEDYDAELAKLKKDNESLKAKVDGIEAKGSQSEAEKAQAAFLVKIDSVDKELKEEGFDGFESCTPMLRQHIHALIMKEPDPKEYLEGRKLLDVDTPEGWKKIYKEEIYPSIEKIITQKKTEDIIDERIARKKKAALSGNSGGRPVQTKKKDDVSELSQKEMHERYMKMRHGNKRAAV